MLGERVQNLHFTDESNGEIYRLLHVAKNVIQREILNPDKQPFVYPIVEVPFQLPQPNNDNNDA